MDKAILLGNIPIQATTWFEKAAEAGDAQGEFLFAVALSEGDGRDRDPRLALQWLDKALIAGDELPDAVRDSARELRGKLAAELSATAKR